jgi:hypothetical protein
VLLLLLALVLVLAVLVGVAVVVVLLLITVAFRCSAMMSSKSSAGGALLFLDFEIAGIT